ncbi:hypothetical protein BN1012_Phect1511 [Candidatus Phaeomarinobacter ectocarpi]|uniref:Uncharacterized protein n=1 Tax=Candidatus Phaeomarinibacter ectocarpi TaxID=1458461 RepID=X5MLS4_9HYPH|nr:hypothetical protein [Candidatus Phaeomarinobacter ectocarpi]CDO59725.1 hypothetical protein BN1012_Phect1511 [Candidatus Phaeomarinobacter ectocarpi]
MALKAVTATQESAVRLDAAMLDRLQWEQFQHDEKYHREIVRLDIQSRLKHMALHFAKYAGELCEEPAETEFKRLVTDALIIGISTSNFLNERIADSLKSNVVGKNPDFVRTLIITSGRMAGACEKMDHMEDFPFRPTISEQVARIVGGALDVFADRGWDFEEVSEARLRPVKQKSIFYEKLEERL